MAGDVLARMTELLAEKAGAERGGAVWRLAAEGRQLDANVIRMAPGAAVAEHREPDLDVLLYVTAGGGELVTGNGRQALEPGGLAFLPRGSRRSLRAGPDGLVYLTAHRRRPGLSIRRPGGEGGEAACLLHRVCEECGRLATEGDARFCSRCGTRLPAG